jgi:hypothetical protein
VSFPNSIGRMYSLQTLHFQNNNFFRELPKSLMNYSSLKLLDAGENVIHKKKGKLQIKKNAPKVCYNVTFLKKIFAPTKIGMQ